jgi:hypothetical protein
MAKKNVSDPVKTVLTISMGFLLVYIAKRWNWALAVSFIVGITGIISTFLSRQIEFLWMKLSKLLSMIVPNILLGIVFYVFLFPIAFISRLFGKKDSLRLRNNQAGTFEVMEKTFSKESFEHPW